MFLPPASGAVPWADMQECWAVNHLRPKHASCALRSHMARRERRRILAVYHVEVQAQWVEDTLESLWWAEAYDVAGIAEDVGGPGKLKVARCERVRG